MLDKTLFVDTSALVAVLNRRDQYHGDASGKFVGALSEGTKFVTTSHVFAETTTRILRGVGAQAAVAAGNAIRRQKEIDMVYPLSATTDQAWKIFAKYGDQGFSMVDCISFAVMKELSITAAFAYDKHFTVFGFALI